jgi:hypothetical protein
MEAGNYSQMQREKRQMQKETIIWRTSILLAGVDLLHYMTGGVVLQYRGVVVIILYYWGV